MGTITIPIRTISTMNAREHWRARTRRVKSERTATYWILAPLPKPDIPVTVLLTRVGPTNGLDEDDNLNGSMKAVRDQIADWLGINDRDPRVKWKYAQRREKSWGVEVQFIAPSVALCQNDAQEVPHG